MMVLAQRVRNMELQHNIFSGRQPLWFLPAAAGHGTVSGFTSPRWRSEEREEERRED